MAKTATQLSAKEIAAQFEVTPRTIRKFFRAEIGRVEKGNRYAFTPAEVRSMKSKFNKWIAAQEAAQVEATDAE